MTILHHADLWVCSLCLDAFSLESIVEICSSNIKCIYWHDLKVALLPPATKCINWYDLKVALLPPATKLRLGNVFTSVCQEFCPQGGGHAWLEVCVAGGHAWQEGMRVRGACVAGDVHGRGACMVGVCV